MDGRGCGGIPELGGNSMGSGRDSRTFQVGNRILALRRGLGLGSLFSDMGGGVELAKMDNGVVAEKDDASKA